MSGLSAGGGPVSALSPESLIAQILPGILISEAAMPSDSLRVK